MQSSPAVASQLKRRAAIECTLQTMQAMGPVYFWTFTTADVVHDPREISRRWHNFLSIMQRQYKGKRRARGLRIYERHPGGHGIHIHFVVNQWLPVNHVREISRAVGFGRIHCKKWEDQDGSCANYLLKYLRKQEDDDWSGTRVYSTFGLRGVASRQCDIEISSPKRTIYLGLAACIVGFSAMPFFERMRATTQAHFAWMASGASQPGEWCAVNLVPPSTIATAPKLDGEAACARSEILAWEREMLRAARSELRENAFREYHQKAAAALVARSRDWA